MLYTSPYGAYTCTTYNQFVLSLAIDFACNNTLGTRGYFEYVLVNDQVTDNEYIVFKYLELLEQFIESKVEDKFMISFFLIVLDEELLNGRHLDKLGIALKDIASTIDDHKIVSDIDWTLSHLDMVYTKFKQRQGK